jgi:hypothetical protein
MLLSASAGRLTRIDSADAAEDSVTPKPTIDARKARRANSAAGVTLQSMMGYAAPRQIVTAFRAKLGIVKGLPRQSKNSATAPQNRAPFWIWNFDYRTRA